MSDRASTQGAEGKMVDAGGAGGGAVVGVPWLGGRGAAGDGENI